MIRSILTIFDGLSKKETEEEQIEIFAFESIDDDEEFASVNVGEPIEETKFEHEPSTNESVLMIKGPEFASSLNSSAAEFIPKWVQDDDSSCESMSCSPISFMPLDFYSLNPGLVHGGHFPTSYSRKAFTLSDAKAFDAKHQTQFDQDESQEILFQKWNVNAQVFVPKGLSNKTDDKITKKELQLLDVEPKDLQLEEPKPTSISTNSELSTNVKIVERVSDPNVSMQDENVSIESDENESEIDDTDLEIPIESTNDEWTLVCKKKKVAKEDQTISEKKVNDEKRRRRRGGRKHGKSNKANLNAITKAIKSKIITPNEIPKVNKIDESNDYESWQKMIKDKVDKKTLHCVILDEKPINTPHNVVQTHVTKRKDFSDAIAISENRGEEFKMNNKQNTIFHDPKKFYKCKIVLAQDLESLAADSFEIFVPKEPVKVVQCTLKKKVELSRMKELGYKYPIFVMDSAKHYLHFLHNSMRYDNVEFVSHEEAEKISWKAMKAKKNQLNEFTNVQPKTLKRKFGRNSEFLSKVAKNVNEQKRPF